MKGIKDRETELSIIVAIYNIKEKILRECLESLMNDKYDNTEIILGDDGSDQETGEICREYAARDSRMIYFRQENRGLSAIRNAALKLAGGRYVTFVDGDDAAPPGYSECICNGLKESGEEYDILMFKIKDFIKDVPCINVKKTSIVNIPSEAAKQFSRACITGEPPRTEDYGITDSTPSSVCIKAYRRQFLIENGLTFKEGLRKSEDVMFNSQAFFYCKRLGYIPEILNLYRMNPDSLTHKYTPYFEEVIRDCIECDIENMKLYDNDADIIKMWGKYKLLHYAITNFELNIFHKKNPKPSKVRREQFESFKHTEPFETFFKTFDFSNYHWNERKLIVKLASKDKFGLLDLMYKFPISFRVYGKLKKIFGKRGYHYAEPNNIT